MTAQLLAPGIFVELTSDAGHHHHLHVVAAGRLREDEVRWLAEQLQKWLDRPSGPLRRLA